MTRILAEQVTTPFWEFAATDFKKTALVSEHDQLISYEQLDTLVNDFCGLLPPARSLVFLEFSSTLDCVVAYLGCLRRDCPVLLLDDNISEEQKTALLELYAPNVLIDRKTATVLHNRKHLLGDDLAVLLSTSGSTGSPKLVRLSRQNLSENARSISSYLALSMDEVAITSLPLNYSYGLSVLNSHLHSKASIVLTESSIISREFWNSVQNHRVTSFSGVPYTYQMLKKLKLDRFPTQSLRYLTQAGGRLDVETTQYIQNICQRSQKQFFVMYGQTEATARIAYVPPGQLTEKMGSIGVAIPNGELSLIDADGLQVESAHCEGELAYQGPNVMLGYAECLQDLARGDEQNGRLKTGDLGYFDEEGFFYVTGRLKRFLKIYGLRLSLDRVDILLAESGFEAVSGGEDERLQLAVVGDDQQAQKARVLVASAFKININSIDAMAVAKIARNHSGKVDYQAALSGICNKAALSGNFNKEPFEYESQSAS